ncbi:beta-hexosaminidase subunit beta-like [Ylistrum balloti]|uniref:beta-hexosaminidase subunit beta-like n=1 Tax=Ylistrum balloti TaxID=509963 RepID=UPI002905D541|nr:beta-hexosaminidase subunit beta-like [Ylistrum balloti]
MDTKLIFSNVIVLMCWVVLASGYITYIAIRLPLQGQRSPPGSPWPHPKEMKLTTEALTLDRSSFKIRSTIKGCDVIDNGITRFRSNLDVGSIDDALQTTEDLQIHVDNSSCQGYPYLGMNESYTLKVDRHSILRANTVWGALRGLETFSQLLYTFPTGQVRINKTEIFDEPRFPHRGIMLDTARHFIPVPILLQNLDAMSYNKFNVFHWHIVDDQSFPYQSIKFPGLSQKGAYSPVHVYSQKDIQRVLQYARLRGIRVIVEFDTPGHTQSWGKFNRDLLTPCWNDGEKGKAKYGRHGEYEIMNPMLNSTFAFLEELFSEVTSVFPDDYIHLGMDEAYHHCWASNPDVADFLTRELGLNASDFSGMEQYYIRRTLDIVSNTQKKAIIWEDPIEVGLEADKDVLVEVWKNKQKWSSNMLNVVQRGYSAILSSCWYLNYIQYGQQWRQYYECDPHNFSGTAQDKSRVLGGEACLWAEYVDGTNLLSRLWPRASAVAERLWSPEHMKNPDDASFRLDQHRCRMLRRGIPAEPILNGFCGDFEVKTDTDEVQQKSVCTNTASAFPVDCFVLVYMGIVLLLSLAPSRLDGE